MSRKVAEERADPGSTSPVMMRGAQEAAVGRGRLGKTNGSAVSAAVAEPVAGPAIGVMPKLAGYLQQHLGSVLTAYLSGAGDQVLVDRWVKGAAEPEGVQVERLKLACEATGYLVRAYGDKTARAWFLGNNNLLDSESPASVLRHGQKPEDWEYVITAARQVVENAR